MLLEIADWKFDIDLEATMEYSGSEAKDHCTCAYCRNFYATVDDTYPQLRPFLAQFGLDIEGPDELFPFAENAMEATYGVKGEILRSGKPMDVGGLSVFPELLLQEEYGCPKPCFVLSIGPLTLPWVLEEPFEEVVSPANQPGFLKRMWNRLLGRAGDTLRS